MGLNCVCNVHIKGKGNPHKQYLSFSFERKYLHQGDITDKESEYIILLATITACFITVIIIFIIIIIIRSVTHPLTNSPGYSFTHPATHSLTHPPNSLTRSLFTHPKMHRPGRRSLKTWQQIGNDRHLPLDKLVMIYPPKHEDATGTRCIQPTATGKRQQLH